MSVVLPKVNLVFTKVEDGDNYKQWKKINTFKILIEINFILVFFEFCPRINLPLLVAWNTFFLYFEQFSDWTRLTSLLLWRNHAHFALQGRNIWAIWFQLALELFPPPMVTVHNALYDWLSPIDIVISFLPSLLESRKAELQQKTTSGINSPNE